MEHFVRQENLDMLFGILNSSNNKINHKNSDILQIFNNTLNTIVKTYPNSSLIEMNKIFLKTIMDELELYFTNKTEVIYQNKEDDQKSRQDEFNRKFEQQLKNFGSFNKKKPDEMDFSDNGNFAPKMGIDQTLVQRVEDLKKITQSYKKNKTIDDGPWLNKKGVVSLKISDTTVQLEPILLDKKNNDNSNKKVRFKTEIENEKMKLTSYLSKLKRITKESTREFTVTEERIKKLENDVDEIRKLIKEVLKNSKK